MIGWLRRTWAGAMYVQQYELVLPHGNREHLWLGPRDNVQLTCTGDPEPVVIIERLGAGHTRITIRSEDDMLTADDLDLLRERKPVPA